MPTQGIASDIQEIFNGNKVEVYVEIILAASLILKMRKLINTSKNDFVVSLDKAYFDCDFHLEMSRTVCQKKSGWQDLGELPRPGCLLLEEQTKKIAESTAGKEVIIVDDGCWTGGTIERIVAVLRREKVSLKEVVFGIMIDRGRINIDVPIRSAYIFPEADVLDWICERDFVPGAPLGGKTVYVEGDDTVNIGAYYLFGMGDYREWASFKELPISHAKWFARRRLHQTAELFEEIGDLSGKPVLLAHLERVPSCFGICDSNSIPFSELLRRQAKKM